MCVSSNKYTILHTYTFLHIHITIHTHSLTSQINRLASLGTPDVFGATFMATTVAPEGSGLTATLLDATQRYVCVFIQPHVCMLLDVYCWMYHNGTCVVLGVWYCWMCVVLLGVCCRMYTPQRFITEIPHCVFRQCNTHTHTHKTHTLQPPRFFSNTGKYKIYCITKLNTQSLVPVSRDTM